MYCTTIKSDKSIDEVKGLQLRRTKSRRELRNEFSFRTHRRVLNAATRSYSKGPELKFSFQLFSVFARETSCGPRKHCFKLGWPWVVRSMGDFSNAKHDSHKLWKFDAKFLVRYPKTLYFNLFGRVILDEQPKSPLFRDKNPVRLHVTFFVSSQRPEVSSEIIETKWKKWKTTFRLPWEKRESFNLRQTERSHFVTAELP